MSKFKPKNITKMYVKWCWLSGLGGVFFLYMMTWPPESKNPKIDMYDDEIVRAHQINLMKTQHPGPATILREKLLRKNLGLKKYKRNLFEYMQDHGVNSETHIEYLKEFIEYYNYMVFMAVAAGAGVVYLTLPKLRECQWPLLINIKSKVLGLLEIDNAPDIIANQDLKETLDRIREVEWESAVLRAQRSQWKSERDHFKKRLESATKEKRDLQNQLVAVQEEIKDVRRDLEAIKLDQALTGSKLEQSKKDFKSVVKKKQYVVKQLENAQKENVILHEQISFLSNEKESVERRLNLIEDELWKMKVSQSPKTSSRERDRCKVMIEEFRLKDKYGSDTVEVGSEHSRGSMQINIGNSDIQEVDIGEAFSDRMSERSSRSEVDSINIHIEQNMSGMQNSLLSNSSWSTCELTHEYGDISSVSNTVGQRSSSCSICEEKKCHLEHDMCENVECLRNCKHCRCRNSLQMMKENIGDATEQKSNCDCNEKISRLSLTCHEITRPDSRRRDKDHRPESAPMESDMSSDSYTDQLDLLKQILETSGIAESRGRKIQSAPGILDPSGTPRPVTGSPAFHLFLRDMRYSASDPRNEVGTLHSQMEFKHVANVPISKSPSEQSSWKSKSHRNITNFVLE